MIRRNAILFVYLAALLSPLFLELQYQSKPQVEAEILLLFALSFFAIASPAIIFQFRVRRYLLVISLPILLLTAMELAHLLEYQSGITRGGLIAVGNTGLGEAKEFVVDLHGTTIAAVMTLFLFCVALLVFGFKADDRIGAHPYVRVAAAVFLLAFSFEFLRKGDTVRHSYPFRIAYTAMDVIKGYLQFQEILVKRAQYSFDATPRADMNDRELIIVVIGESLRRDHLTQYKYFRNTTPILSKSDAIWFTDTISPATTTQISLPAMLTPAIVGNYEDYFNKKSIISVAMEIGFHTSWFSNQRQFDRWGTRVSVIGKEADDVQFISSASSGRSLDERLLPLTRSAVASGRSRQMVFLHTYGNHRIYQRRYPGEFRFYDDVDEIRNYFPHMTDEELQEVNHYDNSIRYVDYFLGEVIDIARSFAGPACVIFFSDHGEGLYDDESKLRGRGFIKPLSASIEIPLFVWATESFKSSRPDRWVSIASNRQKPVLMDSFFHAFSGLIGAQFNDYRPEDDFFSDSYVEPSVRRYDNGWDSIQLSEYSDVIAVPTPWVTR